MLDQQTIQTILKNSECLHDLTAINAALDTMAAAISEKLKHSFPILLCVMSGALIPTGHLLTRLNFPLEIDYIHVTRYRGAARSGDLHWLVEPRLNLAERTVLIVDDVLDGGLTLAAIIDYCRQAKAKQVYSAVMVNKIRTREANINLQPEFVGLETEDKFLFGFGLDYQECLRNMPGIYAVNPDLKI